MEIRDYQEKAQRTCASLGDEKLDLCHMTLGMVSEEEEVAQAITLEDAVNLREELADICWYVANYCTLRGYEFEDILSKSENFGAELEAWESESSPLLIFISRISDYVKKYIAYNKPISRELEEKSLIGILFSVKDLEESFNFKADLGRNIQKLEARYPEKFTNEKAINRNLDVERKILEG
jgi:NTP pyrophosphatase (non-canonical NTP hydrolase)